jgi:hypothetical protein
MWLTTRLVHLVLIALLAWAPVAAAGPSGAVFTTDRDGQYVNANVYDSEGDAYLNGGPRANAPCTAAGLPDGEYYFQVTEPNGFVLSNDDIEERRFSVLNGVIDEYLGGTHAVGDGLGKCGSDTVQLLPTGTFTATTNPGGEYKVWVTRVEDYDPVLGFVHSKSKTDNFKVAPPEVVPD